MTNNLNYIKIMGPFERDILKYVGAQQNESCPLQDLLNELSTKSDYTEDWAVSDINNLIEDGLLSYDQSTGVLTLLSKAKRPVVKLPPNHRG